MQEDDSEDNGGEARQIHSFHLRKKTQKKTHGGAVHTSRQGSAFMEQRNPNRISGKHCPSCRRKQSGTEEEKEQARNTDLAVLL